MQTALTLQTVVQITCVPTVCTLGTANPKHPRTHVSSGRCRCLAVPWYSTHHKLLLMTFQSPTLQLWAQTAGAELLALVNTSMLQRAGFGCWCTSEEVRSCTEIKSWLLSLHLLTCIAASMNTASVVTSMSCRPGHARMKLTARLLRLPARRATAFQLAAQVHSMCCLSSAMFRLCQHTLRHVTMCTSIGTQIVCISGNCVSYALLMCEIHRDLSVQASSVRAHSGNWMLRATAEGACNLLHVL
jgi:hypothetical protein